MKQLFGALAVFLCAVSVVVAAPSLSFAGGGGHGYRHHHGYDHHYGYRRHGSYAHRHRGYRHYYGPGLLFGFSFHGHRRYFGRRPYYGYPGYHDYPPMSYPPPAVRWNQPNRVYVAPPQAQQQQSPGPAQRPEDCKMIREYQTQIMVGGKLVDAYGDACLKEDGSWERGPPKIPPE